MDPENFEAIESAIALLCNASHSTLACVFKDRKRDIKFHEFCAFIRDRVIEGSAKTENTRIELGGDAGDDPAEGPTDLDDDDGDRGSAETGTELENDDDDDSSAENIQRTGLNGNNEKPKDYPVWSFMSYLTTKIQDVEHDTSGDVREAVGLPSGYVDPRENDIQDTKSLRSAQAKLRRLLGQLSLAIEFSAVEVSNGLRSRLENPLHRVRAKGGLEQWSQSFQHPERVRKQSIYGFKVLRLKVEAWKLMRQKKLEKGSSGYVSADGLGLVLAYAPGKFRNVRYKEFPDLLQALCESERCSLIRQLAGDREDWMSKAQTLYDCECSSISH